nr:hypothetical protein [uncultured Enterobacter sp.]
MPSKRLVRFYDNHCSSTIIKIASCERELNSIRMTLSSREAQSHALRHQLHRLWEETYGQTLRQREIFVLKRKEALIRSRQDLIQLEMTELTESLTALTFQRDDFIKLRFHYEKKKQKWEWMLINERKARSRKDIHRDEQAVEECVTWAR